MLHSHLRHDGSCVLMDRITSGDLNIKKVSLTIELFSAHTDISAALIHLKHQDLHSRHSYFPTMGFNKYTLSSYYLELLPNISINSGLKPDFCLTHNSVLGLYHKIHKYYFETVRCLKVEKHKT